jgi:hypothetical protein
VAQVGTAKRVKQAFVKDDGSVIMVGGKTGTGDQRFDVFGAGHRLIESRYVNRSATFVFNIGERFFGTMTAYVHGPQSENYDFTSALPVQLLVNLAPSLMPMIERQPTVAVPGAQATPTMKAAAEKAAALAAAAAAQAAPPDGVAPDQEEAAPPSQDAPDEPAKPQAGAEARHAAPAHEAAQAKPTKPSRLAAEAEADAAHPKAARVKPLHAGGDEAHPGAHLTPRADAPARAKAAQGREAEPRPAPHPKPAAVEEVLQ